MTSNSGIATPTTLARQPRIQIPSALPSLLQTELLLLDRLLRKNRPQHRAGLFYQKCTHVLRLMKRLAVVMTEVVKVNEGGSSCAGLQVVVSGGRKDKNLQKSESSTEKLYGTLVELTDTTLPAITKASDVLEKMINHLHFLPLTTTLLAITSRMFVITIDVASYLIQYRETAQTRIPSKGSGISTPVPGSGKEKEKASFSFEDVVEMVIGGRLKNSRITTAQDELQSRLRAVENIAKRDSKGKGKAAEFPVKEDRSTMLEWEGEDFGEAVEAVMPRPQAVRITANTNASRAKIPIVLETPSSPDEPDLKQSVTIDALKAPNPVNGRPTKATKAVQVKKKDKIEMAKQSAPPAMPQQDKLPEMSSIPQLSTEAPKVRPKPVVEETSGGQKLAKRKSSNSSLGEGDGPKVKKKKKGKNAMDDIFGL